VVRPGLAELGHDDHEVKDTEDSPVLVLRNGGARWDPARKVLPVANPPESPESIFESDFFELLLPFGEKPLLIRLSPLA
jgi:hypothetical protein